MSVHLQFQNTRGLTLHKGPFNSFVLEGETIREQRGGNIIAVHLPHCWSVEGAEFLRLDVEPSVIVTWEGFGGAPSTTGHLSSIDGIAYIDRRVFAVVDRQNDDWYLLREGVHQPVLLVDPAPTPCGHTD